MRHTFLYNGKPLEMTPIRMVNAGYAGSNQAAVQAHIEELAAIGVRVPKRTPTFYPVPVDQLTTGSHIQVTHGKTSAEVEYVYLLIAGKAYITVGSDHTDRELEAYSVRKSKQICPNLVAPEVWSYDSVKGRLDQLALTCEVYENGGWRLYQHGAASAVLAPEQLLDIGRAAVGEMTDGLVLYSGTIPTMGEISYADRWRVSIEDMKLNKRIATEYTVERLPDPIE